jgi:RNA polymerase sigma factor (sigma-70 family)
VARFAGRLVVLARRQLAGRLAGKEDPEDAVQSALRSFFARLRDGQFDLPTWNSVWGLLATITVRKCDNRLVHYRAARRSVGREVALPALPVPDREPTPEEAAALADTLDGVLASLSPRDRDILSMHLAGEDTRAIAAAVCRSERTVRRAIELVRLRLERTLAADLGE